MDELKTHLTPAPHAAVLPAAGPVAAVAAGAPNFLGSASGNNMVQVNQVMGTNLFPSLSPMTPGTPSTITSSHPLQQASQGQSPGSSVMTVPTTPVGKSLTTRQIAMQKATAAAQYLEQKRQERLKLEADKKAAGKKKKAPI